MDQLLLFALLPLLLIGCISLPSQQAQNQRHYSLLPAQSSCTIAPAYPLKIAITEAASGLNSDRIIQHSLDTGEVLYLSQVRWPNETSAMLKQRLAADLEAAGLSIISSHHYRGNISTLNCELRALNLTQSNFKTRAANFAMSCLLQMPDKKLPSPIIINAQTPMESLEANTIVKALSNSYGKGFNQLCQKL